MSNNKDKKINISDGKQQQAISTPIKDEKRNAGGAASSATRVISLIAIFLLIFGLYSYSMIDKSPIQEFVDKVGSENEVVQIQSEGQSEGQSEVQLDDVKRVLENAKKNEAVANSLLSSNNDPELKKSKRIKESVIKGSVTKEPVEESNNKTDSATSEEKSNKQLEEIEHLNPYELELGRVEYIPTVQKHIVLKNATQYRKFLWNAHKMIEKFNKDKVFDEEIRILKMRVLPEEIAEILEKFVQYNNLMKDKDLKPYKQVDFGNEFFDRFLKIKKFNDEYKSVSQLKEEISSEISVFYKYLYSDRLQDEFFGK